MIINNKNHIDSKAVSIIAQSNFREMTNYGFTKKQIINFSTQILDILIKNYFGIIVQTVNLIILPKHI